MSLSCSIASRALRNSAVEIVRAVLLLTQIMPYPSHSQHSLIVLMSSVVPLDVGEYVFVALLSREVVTESCIFSSVEISLEWLTAAGPDQGSAVVCSTLPL